jgi:DNA-binding response OmpR family regulator
MTRVADIDALRGLRVLVVEDMLLVAEMIADMLEVDGVRVVGPVGRVAPAVELARQEMLDGALLDVNLAGESSGPIAQALAERGIPFIFLTGYSDTNALPAAFRDVPRMIKPFQERELVAQMATRFRRAAA